jgi:hypothetical protein
MTRVLILMPLDRRPVAVPAERERPRCGRRRVTASVGRHEAVWQLRKRENQSRTIA